MTTKQLHSASGQVILASSSTGAGDWYRVNQKLGKLTFQVTHNPTSIGATVSSTTVIEASNDGVNALGTVLGTVALAGDNVQANGFAVDAHWEYVRAKINSVGAASAGSTGTGFGISVSVSAQLRS